MSPDVRVNALEICSMVSLAIRIVEKVDWHVWERLLTDKLSTLSGGRGAAVWKEDVDIHTKTFHLCLISHFCRSNLRSCLT